MDGNTPFSPFAAWKRFVTKGLHKQFSICYDLVPIDCTLTIFVMVTSMVLDQCLITNASQPAMVMGVSPGARMQPVVADLQEGQGDPNRVRGPEGYLCYYGNPHQTHIILALQCQTQESNDLQHLQLMKYWYWIHEFQSNYNARPRICFLNDIKNICKSNWNIHFLVGEMFLGKDQMSQLTFFW